MFSLDREFEYCEQRREALLREADEWRALRMAGAAPRGLKFREAVTVLGILLVKVGYALQQYGAPATYRQPGREAAAGRS